jgi:hypothetical protein
LREDAVRAIVLDHLQRIDDNNTIETMLYDTFCSYGEIERIFHQHSRAIIIFSKEASAQAAVNGVHGSSEFIFYGQTGVTVELATSLLEKLPPPAPESSGTVNQPPNYDSFTLAAGRFLGTALIGAEKTGVVVRNYAVSYGIVDRASKALQYSRESVGHIDRSYRVSERITPAYTAAVSTLSKGAEQASIAAKHLSAKVASNETIGPAYSATLNVLGRVGSAIKDTIDVASKELIQARRTSATLSSPPSAGSPAVPAVSP